MTPYAGISDSCFDFYDVDRKLSINLVAFAQSNFRPQTGEMVELPGGEGGQGRGTYRVVGVIHTFTDVRDPIEHFSPARLVSMRIEVKSVAAA